ncbi:FAD-linked sulfhydryl oxidase ALR-like [Clavelina lepadiformis]|uniref:FAD-linked sulfhydryl oxidase ALR-like n=1 Tax=Clavelina lepadiformis TaxID=159417 RepID=UPI00404132C7
MGSAGRVFGGLQEEDIPEESYGRRARRACRVCDDFKTWRKKKESDEQVQPDTSASAECPLTNVELGRNTWSFLHTMAAYYPEKPSEKQKTDMTGFMELFSKFYPCDYCAKDFRKNLKESRPDVRDRYTFSKWMCVQHNLVNKKIGKPEFDCSKVMERWRDGWKDGSCD